MFSVAIVFTVDLHHTHTHVNGILNVALHYVSRIAITVIL